MTVTSFLTSTIQWLLSPLTSLLSLTSGKLVSHLQQLLQALVIFIFTSLYLVWLMFLAVAFYSTLYYTYMPTQLHEHLVHLDHDDFKTSSPHGVAVHAHGKGAPRTGPSAMIATSSSSSSSSSTSFSTMSEEASDKVTHYRQSRVVLDEHSSLLGPVGVVNLRGEAWGRSAWAVANLSSAVQYVRRGHGGLDAAYVYDVDVWLRVDDRVEWNSPPRSGERLTMLKVDLFCADEEQHGEQLFYVASSKRVVPPEAVSFAFKVARRVLLSPLYVIGFLREERSVRVRMFEGFVEDAHCRVAVARVSLSHHDPAMRVMEAKLLFHVQLFGLQYFLYHWPLTSTVVMVANILALEVVCSLIVVIMLYTRCCSQDEGGDDDGGLPVDEGPVNPLAGMRRSGSGGRPARPRGPVEDLLVDAEEEEADSEEWVSNPASSEASPESSEVSSAAAGAPPPRSTLRQRKRNG